MLVFTIVIICAVLYIIGLEINDAGWCKEIVARGYGKFLVEDGTIVFRWNDEIETRNEMARLMHPEFKD